MCAFRIRARGVPSRCGGVLLLHQACGWKEDNRGVVQTHPLEVRRFVATRLISIGSFVDEAPSTLSVTQDCAEDGNKGRIKEHGCSYASISSYPFSQASVRPWLKALQKTTQRNVHLCQSYVGYSEIV